MTPGINYYEWQKRFAWLPQRCGDGWVWLRPYFERYCQWYAPHESYQGWTEKIKASPNQTS